MTHRKSLYDVYNEKMAILELSKYPKLRPIYISVECKSSFKSTKYVFDTNEIMDTDGKLYTPGDNILKNAVENNLTIIGDDTDPDFLPILYSFYTRGSLVPHCEIDNVDIYKDCYKKYGLHFMIPAINEYVVAKSTWCIIL
jgi:hypothetical protein